MLQAIRKMEPGRLAAARRDRHQDETPSDELMSVFGAAEPENSHVYALDHTTCHPAPGAQGASVIVVRDADVRSLPAGGNPVRTVSVESPVPPPISCFSTSSASAKATPRSSLAPTARESEDFWRCRSGRPFRVRRQCPAQPSTDGPRIRRRRTPSIGSERRSRERGSACAVVRRNVDVCTAPLCRLPVD